MSFMDPMGFSNYSMYPTSQTTFMPPAVQPQMYPSYGGSPFGGPPSVSPYCYPPQQQPGYDPSGGMTGLMGMLLNMFMSVFMGQGGIGGGSTDPTQGVNPVDPTQGGVPTDPTQGGVPTDPTQPTTPTDTRPQEIQGLDANTNTDLLQILSVYGSDLGGQNGKLTLSDLKKVAYLDVPDTVKQAAQNLANNPDLYNLLCLQSHNSPSEGFQISQLSYDWTDKVDIDNLQSYSSTHDAVSALKSSSKLTALEQLTGGAGSTDISRDDLERVALGTAGSQFKDPELQAAALKLLSDSDSWDSLDTIKSTPGADGAPATITYDNTQDDAFDGNSLGDWLSQN